MAKPTVVDAGKEQQRVRRATSLAEIALLVFDTRSSQDRPVYARLYFLLLVSVALFLREGFSYLRNDDAGF
jgi:hypothetical protein